MNRGVNRQVVFFSDHDRVDFGRTLATIHERFGISTLAYCLMGNHYHLLVRDLDRALPAAMQYVGTVYTSRVNERLGRDGPLFRGRYHSIPVETDSYLMWVARYIHRNPLALDDIQRPEQFRWSSYRSYLGARLTPSFVDLRPVMGLFDDDVARLAAFTDDEAAEADHGDVRAVADIATWQAGLEADGAVDPWRTRSLLLLLTEHPGLGPGMSSRVRDELSHPHEASRRAAVARAHARLADDPVLAAAYDALIAQYRLDHAA